MPISGRIDGDWVKAAGYEILEVPAGKTWTLTGFIATNQESTPHWLSLHRFGSGGSAEDKNRILAQSVIIGNETITGFRGLILLAGDKLVAVADEDDVVSIEVSYVEEAVS